MHSTKWLVKQNRDGSIFLGDESHCKNGSAVR